jgi:hypothetical protein
VDCVAKKIASDELEKSLSHSLGPFYHQLPNMLALCLLAFLAPVLDASFVTQVAKLKPRDPQVTAPDTVGFHSKTVIGTSTSCMSACLLLVMGLPLIATDDPKTCSSGSTFYALGGATKYGGCCTGASCSMVATGCTGGYKVFSGSATTASSSYWLVNTSPKWLSNC